MSMNQLYIFILLFLVSLLLAYEASAQTSLRRGDIAIVGVNANNNSCSGYSGAGEDVVSWISFKDILPGTVIDVTDNGWERQIANRFGSTEGTLRFTYNGTGNIPRGTRIDWIFRGSVGETAAANGDWNVISLNGSANLNLNTGGDQIFFMQGGDWNCGGTHNCQYTGTILYGFSTTANWIGFANNSQNSGLPSELQPCFHMQPATGTTDYLSYQSPTSPTTQLSWISRIKNGGNWQPYGNCGAYQMPPPFFEIEDSQLNIYCENEPCIFCANSPNIEILFSGESGILYTVTVEYGPVGGPYQELAFGGVSSDDILSFPPITQTSEYILSIVTDQDNCPVYSDLGDPVTVIIFPAPDLQASADPPQVCEGNDITLSAGPGPFSSVSWAGPGGFSSTETNPVLSDAQQSQSGTYIVTVTDANGCSNTASTNVLVTDGPDVVISPDITICSGESTTLTASGGSGYTWSQGGSSSSIVVSPPGTTEYTVTVSQAGCSATASVTVSVSDAPTATASNNSPICSGQGTSLELTAGGGSSYQWSGPGGFGSGDRNPVITDPQSTQSGVYIVTVTNGAGCSSTAETTVTIYEGFELEGSVFSDVLCANGSTGSFTLYVNGSPQMVPPPTLIWSNPAGFDPNQQTFDFSGTNLYNNAPAGIYALTITDARGCSASVSLVISEPDALSLSCSVLNHETSPGAQDGSATFSISGGTVAYDFSLSGPAPEQSSGNPAGTYTYDDLPPGNYSIVVTDENDCSASCSFAINGANCTLDIQVVLTVDPSCHGQSNGSIEILVSGANGGISYTWTGPSPIGNSPIGNNLESGTYHVTVEDSDGCQAEATIILTAPGQLTLSCYMVDPASGQGQQDGTAGLDISGGTSPYTIEWTNGTDSGQLTTSQSSVLLQDLAPGIYDVTVTDDNGCVITCSFEITAEPVLCNMTVTLSIVQPISCPGGQDGMLLATVTGDGQSPFHYQWSLPSLPDQPQATGLSAGSYAVTVTDDNGCTATANILLSEPQGPSLTCEAHGETSPGLGDGSVDITIAGGTAPYDIDWSGPVSGSVDNENGPNWEIPGLQVGTYTITVTDENGCSSTCMSTVMASGCNVLFELLLMNPIQCAGDNDASLLADFSGGLPPYDYNWNGPVSIPSDENNPQGLPAGSYSVTVTDVNGCTATGSILIQEPLPLGLICNGIAETAPDANDGQLVLNINGGAAPYQAAYSGPASGSSSFAGPGIFTISDLPPGIYLLEVTDANGCTTTCTTSIQSADCQITLDLSLTSPIRCGGEASAALSAVPAGGMTPYSYTWNGPVSIPADEATPQNLPAGTYAVTVTDANGCTVTGSILVQEPLPLELMCSSIAETAPDANDGQLVFDISGGTAPYQAVYVGPVNGNGPFAAPGTFTIASLPPGIYLLQVTDDNGCTATCTSIISSADCDISLQESHEDLDCHADQSGAISLFVSGAQGNITYDWSGPTTVGNVPAATGLDAGVYNITAVDQAGCVATIEITLSEPAPIALDCNVLQHETSPGTQDGRASISWTGGTGPFTYHIQGPQGSTSNSTPNRSVGINSQPGGIYQVLVTDANGCTGTCSFIIETGDCDLSVDLQQTAVLLCHGDAIASLLATVTGQNGTVDYTWSGPVSIGNTGSPAGLSAGSYGVTVSDFTGCSAFALIEITEPTALVLSCSELQAASAPGVTDGSAQVTLSGGTIPYTLSWQGPVSGQISPPDGGTFNISGLSAGIYDIVVTDANGCTTVCNTEITAPVPCDLEVNCAVITVASGPGQADGEIRFTWNNTNEPADLIVTAPGGAQSSHMATGSFTLTNVSPGVYTILVTDAAGCTATCSIELGFEIVCELDATLSVTSQVSCNGSRDGALSLDIQGASGTATIRWEDGSGGQTRQGLGAGTYSYTITDALQCETTGTVTLLEPELLAAASGIEQPDCDRSTGIVTLTSITGGTAPYTVTWSGGSLIADELPLALAPLPPGNYELTITDTRACSVTVQFTINAADQLIISPIADLTVRAGSSVSFTLSLNRAEDEISSIVATYNDSLLCTGCFTHSWSPTGNGEVRITVTDNYGCTAEISFSVTLTYSGDVFIPEVFSPNGDGVNDIFTVYPGPDISAVRNMRIFDRWGNELFFLEELPLGEGRGWDGSSRGKSLNPAVFVYSVEIELRGGETKLLFGEVSLVR